MTTIRKIARYCGVLLAVASGLTTYRLAAQQPAPTPAARSAPTVLETKAYTKYQDDASRKAIMASPAWKQVNTEYQKWISTQAIYTPSDVRRMNANVAAQIQSLPTSELQQFLDDWEAKLKILNGKDFQDAQQWLGQYMSVLTDPARNRTLAQMGLTNVANMTAAQLEDAIVRIRADRLAAQQGQAAYYQSQQQIAQSLQRRSAAQQSSGMQYGAPGYNTMQSPYSSPKFNPAPPPQPQFYMDGYGRIGYSLPF